MGLTFVRYVLPALIAVAGVILVATGGDAAVGAGIVLIGVAGLVVLANLFIRLALRSERDRADEERRRNRV
jgi:drug/metabolite transporter (DMT)-like permease